MNRTKKYKTFHKLTGAGNCFILADLRDGRMRAPRDQRRQWARKLCNVYTSIGADGLLFLENLRPTDLKWDFYNADGSSAEMCGNAARCVAAYLLQLNNEMTTTTILTRSGIIEVTPLRHRHEFRVTMPALCEIELGRDFDFIDSGVPHAVVRLQKSKLLDDFDFLSESVEKIRALSRFKKRGVNVTFYALISSSRRRIRSLTFERGVPGFTQACGTGAVAAAAAFAAHSPKATGGRAHADRIQVDVPGGRLYVELGCERPILTGPASYVAELRASL